MAAVAEETTLIEVEATEVTIVPTTEHTMVMEAILMEETVVDARAQKLAETVVHTTVVVRLVVEMLEDAQAQRLDVSGAYNGGGSFGGGILEVG
jgi:hypothetical protein